MKPDVNVTPLIDVLLVLLIIFMVISPLKHEKFEANIPAKPLLERSAANPYTLVVKINSDSSIELNDKIGYGTIDDTSLLIARLKEIFELRRLEDARTDQSGNPLEVGVRRTVFIKAPRVFGYGAVIKVIDGVKQTGAFPIGLQIDELE